MKCYLYLPVSLFVVMILIGCDFASDTKDEKTQSIYFPTTVGSKWVYEKTITKSTSGYASTPLTLYIYLELKDYDQGVYQIEKTMPIKHTKYYGIPGPPPSDLITYYTITESLLLRNKGEKLQYSSDNGANWKTLCSRNKNDVYNFSSFLVAGQDRSVSSEVYTGYIGSFPSHPLGQFEGIRTYGYWPSGLTTYYEFYTEEIGIIESMIGGQYYDPGISGLISGSTTYDVQSVKLLGYRIGTQADGVDPDILQYGATFEY